MNPCVGEKAWRHRTRLSAPGEVESVFAKVVYLRDAETEAFSRPHLLLQVPTGTRKQTVRGGRCEKGKFRSRLTRVQESTAVEARPSHFNALSARERERERERERQRDKETKREREKEREKKTDRQTD